MIAVYSFVTNTTDNSPDELYEACFARLSDGERARAQRLIHARPRREFVLTRAGLRNLLGQWTGIPADRISFGQNAAGKPHLDQHRGQDRESVHTHFNVSHSHGVSLIAICPNREIGVDLEPVRDLRSREALARRWFHPEEVKALEQKSWEPAAFFAIWTAKEAVVKALGTGLGFGMDEVWIEVADPARPVLRQLGKSDSKPIGWTLIGQSVLGSHWACISYKGAELPVFWQILANPLEDLGIPTKARGITG